MHPLQKCDHKEYHVLEGSQVKKVKITPHLFGESSVCIFQLQEMLATNWGVQNKTLSKIMGCHRVWTGARCLPSTISTRKIIHWFWDQDRSIRFCSVSDEDPPAGQYTVPRLLIYKQVTELDCYLKEIVFWGRKGGWWQKIQKTKKIHCWNLTFFSFCISEGLSLWGFWL